MDHAPSSAADPLIQYLNKDQLQSVMTQTKKRMEQAAKDLDFINAARLRDEMLAIQKQLEISIV